jgi:Site-specific recombinase XerD
MTVSIDELPDEVQTLVEQATESLQPISPSDGIDRFLDWKKEETSPQTITEYRRKLEHFSDFCQRRDIDNLNELDGRLLQDYRRYRRVETAPQSAPLSPKTMRDDMYLFRDFVDYLEGIDGVSAGLSETIRIPDLDKTMAFVISTSLSIGSTKFWHTSINTSMQAARMSYGHSTPIPGVAQVDSMGWIWKISIWRRIIHTSSFATDPEKQS